MTYVIEIKQLMPWMVSKILPDRQKACGGSGVLRLCITISLNLRSLRKFLAPLGFSILHPQSSILVGCGRQPGCASVVKFS
jgi:hypothetical protein